MLGGWEVVRGHGAEQTAGKAGLSRSTRAEGLTCDAEEFKRG